MVEWINNLPTTKIRRLHLRKKQTPAEVVLWSYLRSERLGGYKFYRQFSIGQFILDFYCHSQKLAIELDGEIHKEHKNYDINRTIYLENNGITVIRFWNKDVIKHPKNVCEIILNAIHHK